MVMKVIARLFWKLPEPFHTWLSNITGGWRVVYLPDPKLIAADQYRWECWPGNVRPVEYNAK